MATTQSNTDPWVTLVAQLDGQRFGRKMIRKPVARGSGDDVSTKISQCGHYYEDISLI
jgi:hypothetical protein